MPKRITLITAVVFLGGAAGISPLTQVNAQNFANTVVEEQKTNQLKTSDEKTPTEELKAKSPKHMDEDTQKIGDALKRVAEDKVAETASISLLETSSKYTLGENDVIEIKVMRHPEVSGQYQINQEGKIQYEFIGDIKISGTTKDEAAKIVSERLSEYVISPEVSVKIVGYNSKVVYVVGEVGVPGKIYMRGDTITVREALVQAGLPQLSGVTRKSRLITPSEKGKGDVRRVDVYALLYEGDLTQNFTMKPGDVIFIPATFLTKAMRAIQPVASPVSTAVGTGRTVATPFP